MFFHRGGEQLAGFKVQDDRGVASRVQLNCGQIPHLFPEYGKGTHCRSDCILLTLDQFIFASMFFNNK